MPDQTGCFQKKPTMGRASGVHTVQYAKRGAKSRQPSLAAVKDMPGKGSSEPCFDLRQGSFGGLDELFAGRFLRLGHLLKLGDGLF